MKREIIFVAVALVVLTLIGIILMDSNITGNAISYSCCKVGRNVYIRANCVAGSAVTSWSACQRYTSCSSWCASQRYSMGITSEQRCTCATSADCSDTDGGDFPEVLGFVTGPAGSFIDFCMNSSTLREVNCNGITLEYIYHDCTLGNKVCRESACRVPEAAPTTCTDSDGGQDFLRYGTVTDYGGSTSDYCSNGNVLVERYCFSGGRTWRSYDCSANGKHCVSGACI